MTTKTIVTINIVCTNGDNRDRREALGKLIARRLEVDNGSGTGVFTEKPDSLFQDTAITISTREE